MRALGAPLLAAAAVALGAAPAGHAAERAAASAGDTAAHAAKRAGKKARARSRRVVARGRQGRRLGAAPAGWGAWWTTPTAAAGTPIADGGGDGTGTSTGTGTTGTTTPGRKPGTGGGTVVVPDLPPDDPRSVAVVSREWSFTLSQPTVKAGTVQVLFDNTRADDDHAMNVRGTALATGRVAAGTYKPVAFDLTPGTYTLFCPLPEHEGLGMKATLTVVP